MGKIGIIIVDSDGFIIDALFSQDYPALANIRKLVGTNISKHLFDPKIKTAIELIKTAIKQGFPENNKISIKTKSANKIGIIGIREARIVPRDAKTAFIIITAIKNINATKKTNKV